MLDSTWSFLVITILCTNAAVALAFYTPPSRPFGVESAERIVRSIQREQKRRARKLEDCDECGTKRAVNLSREDRIKRLWQWAQEEGVVFSDKIHLQKDEDGLFGILLKSPLGLNVTETDDSMGSGQRHVLIEIPDDLVLSSSMLDAETTKLVSEFCARHNNAYLRPNVLCLMLVVLKEYRKGEAGQWYPYFQSMPETFDICLQWSETERAYATALGLESTVATVDGAYDMFEQMALQLFMDCPQKDIEWAFSVVMQRSWGAHYTDDNGAPVVNLVCIGDMFNHRKDGAIFFSHEKGEPCSLFAEGMHNEGDGLFMNYFGTGGSTPTTTKCVAQYGFCDEGDIPAAFIMQWLGNMARGDDEKENQFNEMRFYDYEAMSFHSDGRISRHLWDATLYLELRYLLKDAYDYLIKRSNGIVGTGDKPKHNCTTILPDLKRCERALLRKETDDIGTLRSLHQKYFPEVAKTLLQSAELLIESRGPLPREADKSETTSSSWKLLRRYHEHQIVLHKKVCANLRRDISAYEYINR